MQAAESALAVSLALERVAAAAGGAAATTQMQRPLFAGTTSDKGSDAMPFLAFPARVAGERSCVPLPPSLGEEFLLVDAALESMALEQPKKPDDVSDGSKTSAGAKSKQPPTDLERPPTKLVARRVSGYNLTFPPPVNATAAFHASGDGATKSGAPVPQSPAAQAPRGGDTDMSTNDDCDAFPRLEDLQVPTCFSSPALDPVLQDSAARALNKRRRAASFPPAKPFRLEARMVLFRNSELNGQWQETQLSPPARKQSAPLPLVAEQPAAEEEQDDALSAGADASDASRTDIEAAAPVPTAGGQQESSTAVATSSGPADGAAEETSSAAGPAAARTAASETEMLDVKPARPTQRSPRKAITISIDFTESDDDAAPEPSTARRIAPLFLGSNEMDEDQDMDCLPPPPPPPARKVAPAPVRPLVPDQGNDEEMDDLPPPPPKMFSRPAGSSTPVAKKTGAETSASGPVPANGAQQEARDDGADEEMPPPPSSTRPRSLLRPIVFAPPSLRASSTPGGARAEGAEPPGAPHMGPTDRPRTGTALSRSPSPSDRARRPVDPLAQPAGSSTRLTGDGTPSERPPSASSDEDSTADGAARRQHKRARLETRVPARASSGSAEAGSQRTAARGSAGALRGGGERRGYVFGSGGCFTSSMRPGVLWSQAESAVVGMAVLEAGERHVDWKAVAEKVNEVADGTGSRTPSAAFFHWVQTLRGRLEVSLGLPKTPVEIAMRYAPPRNNSRR